MSGVFVSSYSSMCVCRGPFIIPNIFAISVVFSRGISVGDFSAISSMISFYISSLMYSYLFEISHFYVACEICIYTISTRIPWYRIPPHVCYLVIYVVYYAKITPITASHSSLLCGAVYVTESQTFKLWDLF